MHPTLNKQCKIDKSLNITGLLLVICVVASSSIKLSYAQDFKNAEFLGVAIYRLAEHINWPEQSRLKEYRIHLIDDSPEIETVLKKIATTRQLHNRPMHIERNSDYVIPANTQIVFISQHHSKALDKVLEQTKNLSTLIFTYEINDQRHIMINFKIATEDSSKIDFEINKANILNRNMRINPDIILLGGTEIDVAKLYRDSQAELKQSEHNLEIIEEKIHKISQEKLILEKSLSTLTSTIEQQKQNFNKLKLNIEQKEEQIRNQKKKLNKRELYLKKQNDEIKKRSAILSEQQNKIDTFSTTISEQNKLLSEQTRSLQKSSEKIESQQSYLIFLSVLITLSILSAVTAFYFHKRNQKINLKLVKSLDETKQYANRLEIANEQLKSFSYTVSHDLRSPLRSASGFSEILIEDYSENLSEDAKDYLNRIVQNIEKMDDLITEILTLSKLSQTEIKYKDDVNLSDLVRKELTELSHSSPRENVDLNIKENVTCRCDPGLIQIAIANLVGNAWKYTSKTKSTHFEFGTKIVDSKTVYYFKDNGAGFNMSLSGKLFEPFQRLHTPKEFEGTGIGLATVKRIINLHQGSIWAESETGKGATFFFVL